MEYVLVVYPTDRIVYIDGENSGQTNTVLRVDAGTHIFELGNPKNFTPVSCKILVQDTTELNPLKVVFRKKEQ
jgi:hypothetical protein